MPSCAVHVPEFDAGEGNRAPRRRHRGAPAAARREASAGALREERAREGARGLSVGLLATLARRAALAPRRLVLPEGEDPRIVRAAATLTTRKLARVTLLGRPDKVRDVARAASANLVGVEVIDSTAAALVARTRAALVAARGDRIDAARAALEAEPRDDAGRVPGARRRGRRVRGRRDARHERRAAGGASSCSARRRGCARWRRTSRW